MKKLLLIAALATMATTAMAAAPKDLTEGTAKADVEVRAEIVNEALTITDIYGGPIIIDFGQQQVKENAYNVGMTKKYKVNAAAPADKGFTLKATIGGDTKPVDVKLKDFTNASNVATLTSNLTLREGTLQMEPGKDEVYGNIDAKLTVPGKTTAVVGKYVGHAELKVQVGA